MMPVLIFFDQVLYIFYFTFKYSTVFFFYFLSTVQFLFNF